MNREYLAEDKRLKPCPLCNSNVRKRLNPKDDGYYSLGIGCICGYEWESNVYEMQHKASREGVNEWNRIVGNGE